MTALQNKLLLFTEAELSTQTDSILKYLMAEHMPYSIINMAVYATLQHKELRKALALARLQALANPADPNVWDTYGEVYYFLGENKLAKKYELQSKRIDKAFTEGGELTWNKELGEFKKKWAEQ